MSKVNVRSPQALLDFKSALVDFGNSGRDALLSINQEIRLTMDWLNEQERRWQHELARAVEQVQQAKRAVAACEASRYYDAKSGRAYVPDCSAQQQALQQAHSRQRDAERQLGVVKQHIRLVIDAARAFQGQSQRLSQMLSHDVPHGAAFLQNRVIALQAFLAASAPTTGSSLSGAAGPSSIVTPPAAPAWIDIGIQTVSIDQIDLSDSPVQGAQDFRKVSLQEMQAGLQRLQSVVAPAVARGADSDYFYHMDQAMHLDYANGNQRIYDAFYGKDAIHLVQVGTQYQVTNGYHRLYAARQLGISSLPATVRTQKP